MLARVLTRKGARTTVRHVPTRVVPSCEVSAKENGIKVLVKGDARHASVMLWGDRVNRTDRKGAEARSLFARAMAAISRHEGRGRAVYINDAILTGGRGKPLAFTATSRTAGGKPGAWDALKSYLGKLGRADTVTSKVDNVLHKNPPRFHENPMANNGV